MRPGTATRLDAIINAALRGELDATHARRLHALGPEAVALAMLAASKRIAELQGLSQTQPPCPAAPSGMMPVCTKPNTPKRRKKPGAKKGHPGHRHKPARRS